MGTWMDFNSQEPAVLAAMRDALKRPAESYAPVVAIATLTRDAPQYVSHFPGMGRFVPDRMGRLPFQEKPEQELRVEADNALVIAINRGDYQVMVWNGRLVLPEARGGDVLLSVYSLQESDRFLQALRAEVEQASALVSREQDSVMIRPGVHERHAVFVKAASPLGDALRAVYPGASVDVSGDHIELPGGFPGYEQAVSAVVGVVVQAALLREARDRPLPDQAARHAATGWLASQDGWSEAFRYEAGEGPRDVVRLDVKCLAEHVPGDPQRRAFAYRLWRGEELLTACREDIREAYCPSPIGNEKPCNRLAPVEVGDLLQAALDDPDESGSGQEQTGRMLRFIRAAVGQDVSHRAMALMDGGGEEDEDGEEAQHAAPAARG